jgi:prolyl 4-hydroxylase
VSAPEPEPPAYNPDRRALKAVGTQVRRRLERDPAVSRIAPYHVELYGGADFLSASECDRLIAMVDAVAKPSTLYDETELSGRTSYSGDFDRADPFVRMVERRIDDLVGLPNPWGETIQGQRYLPGQEFRHHCDWFRTDGSYWPGEAAAGGQRSWTAMIYLNDVEEGGATSFHYLEMAIPPRRGAILLWNNATPEGEPNHLALHAGTPVIRGVKYIITKWYRTRPWAGAGL